MHARRPIVQRAPQQRRVRRWSTAASTTTNAGAAAAALTAPTTSGSDFDAYVHSECGDVVFDAASAAGPSPAVHRLHSGSAVAALPPSHAVLNNVNSAVWLHVLTALQQRGALSRSDCASAIRYLPAFTFRPLLPWLWAPAHTLSPPSADTGAEDAAAGDADTARRPQRNAATGMSAAEEVAADVYNNMSLVALELARRAPPVPTSPPVFASAFTVADFSTAAPQQWAHMARLLAARVAASATRQARLQVWHDILFTLRSHAVWDPTAGQLQSVAHPQLLEVFAAFYADMRSHASAGDGNTTAGAARGAASAAVVVTLTPPILLRKFRALYRQHRHSAMLFAEVYAICVQQEEASGDWTGASAHEDGAKEAPLRTTALLMDIDLAVYYATLPGRRHCGLSTPADQWAATLDHLRFLVPRLLRLQRCQTALLSPPDSAWQPWQRVAAALMNVCVWVENNNAEAERCCAALGATVDALRVLSAAPAPEEARDAPPVHPLLEAPTTEEVSRCVTVVVRAAADSMRHKALQLHYGPTDGLFGIQLLSTAVTAVLPQQQQHQQQQRTTPSHGAAWVTETKCSGTTGDGAQTTTATTASSADVLHRLHLLTLPAKPTPGDIWAALRRTPHITTAARYGLVTTGYRIFSEGVVQQAGQTATAATARRLLDCLCAWADVVGRPLGLRGRQVYALWRLRWTQAQKKIGAQAADDAAAVLERLSPERWGSAARGHRWVCGCGFHNDSPSADEHDSTASTSCVSCVLRTLVPHAWECPTCHTVARSGVHVPYCLHCGEAHPGQPAVAPAASAPPSHDVSHHAGVVELLADTAGLRTGRAAVTGISRCCWDCGRTLKHGSTCCRAHEEATVVSAPTSAREEEEAPAAAAASAVADGLVFVCDACHGVSARPSAPLPLSATPLADASVEAHSCGACGSHEGGHYAAAFTWACGCGASNAALHDYCHACSRAAEQPMLTCPQCRHAYADVDAAHCGRCGFPHPRRLAAVTATRLVRCPACQGHVPAASGSCPHCGSTAVGAVAALLPTVADQPWACLHCGHAHHLRSAETGALLPPPHLQKQRGGAGDALPLLPRTVPPLTGASAGGMAAASHTDSCCARCGTRRVPPSAWEAGRLWSCTACGENYNCGAACRRCAALAPGVPSAHVHVWRCGGCGSDYPSWERTCTTVGCGCGAEDSGVVLFCYAPWDCPACGDVTLSSHADCCTGCGAATPAEVVASPCTAAACVRAQGRAAAPTAAHAATGDASGRPASAPADLTGAAATAAAAVDAPTRLAQVEAFLLRAAATDAPLPAAAVDAGLVHATTAASLWPTAEKLMSPMAAPAAAADAASSTADVWSGLEGGEEAWEDAYRAAVMSF